MSGGILFCVLGGILQEVLHWLQLRSRLTAEEFGKAARSRWTWVLSFFIIAVALPVLAAVWFDKPGVVPTPKDYVLFGAGVPLLLKSGAGASMASGSLVKLGPVGALRRYLGMG